MAGDVSADGNETVAQEVCGIVMAWEWVLFRLPGEGRSGKWYA